MSPLLFSLVMDELLDKLDELRAGFTICSGTTLCSLVFADDILLLSDCKAGLQSQLLTCYKFFQARNLAVNVGKCSSLRLYRVPKQRTVNVDVRPKFYLNPLEPNTLLPCFTASGFLKYLGVDFNPFGRRKCQIEKADILIKRACNAELKPQQKIEMIRTYLVPRFLYSLTVGNPLAHTAKSIDKMIRQAVKTILHLPLTTLCDDIFYIPIARGGLGFTNLSEVSDLSILKLIRKMEASDDPAAQATASLFANQKMKTKLMRRLDIPSLTNSEISAAKSRMAQMHIDRFLATYQGSGFQEFAERCSNEWIMGDRMTGRSFIASIKARTNLVPTRMQTFRGRADPGDQRVRCRRCGHISGAPESLAHISQTCAFTHGLITRRHDALTNKIASVAEDAGYECLKEPILRYLGQTYKPDLVLSKGDQSFIIDVAVPYETREPLARRYREKCRKYEELSQTVCELTSTKRCRTGAIVVGARGAWCSKNDETLKMLDILVSTRSKALMCLSTLEKTNQLIAWFMRAAVPLTLTRGG